MEVRTPKTDGGVFVLPVSMDAPGEGGAAGAAFRFDETATTASLFASSDHTPNTSPPVSPELSDGGAAAFLGRDDDDAAWEKKPMR